MKKLIPALLLSATFLFSVSPLVLAQPVADKAKMEQMKMQKININTASLEELTILPGVGSKKAAAIIEYREQVGKFTSLEQIAEVKGVGKKMLEKMKDQVSL
jgi:competence protein ComEA